MKNKQKLLSLLIFIIFVHQISSERYCGYKGNLAQNIKSQLDDCFSTNVVESRVKMSVGFEYCFGFNYETLNSTVAVSFQKRMNDTTKHLLHLAYKICSNGDNGLDNDFFVLDDSGNTSSDFDDLEGPKTTENIHNCRMFFGNIISSVENRNFDIDGVIGANESLLKPLIQSSANRNKLFKIIDEIVLPLSECSQPMEELKVTLIKSYLKQYLVALISPSMPSFNSQSLDVLLHPDLYLIRSGESLFPTTQGPSKKTTVSAASQLIGSKRIVYLHHGPTPLDLTKDEQKKVLNFDKDNADKTPDQIDKELQERAAKKKLTDTDKLAMTPLQKLQNGVIDQATYNSLITIPEHHEPVEIEHFWDDNLVLKKKRFNNEDFKRYKINGFDIDQKIKNLFKNR